jgi:hypothetical protein
LLDHDAGGQPDLGAVEVHVNQGELLGLSRCGISGAQHQDGKKDHEPAESSAPPLGLVHGDVSLAATRAPSCGAPVPLEATSSLLEEVCQNHARHTASRHCAITPLLTFPTPFVNICPHGCPKTSYPIPQVNID